MSRVHFRAGYVFVAESMLRSAVRQVRSGLARKADCEVVSAQDVEQASYHLVHSAEPFTLKRPATFTNQDWRAFQLRNVGSVPASFVLDLSGCVVGPHGWVRAPDGRYIGDVWSEEGFPTAKMLADDIGAVKGPTQSLSGTSVCLTMPWIQNYYHWTLQNVPRVSMITKFVDIADVDHWIVPHPLTSYMRDWLMLLGIPTERLVPALNGVLSCDRLLVASIPAPNRWIPDWVVSYVRSYAPPPAGKRRRVYIERNRNDPRKVVNQDALHALLGKAGVEVVTMSGLSVTDQMSLFADASLIVSVLGAALTNLVYCRPDTTVVELLPANLTFPAYYKLSAALGLNYVGSIGLEPRVPLPFYQTNPLADLVADIKGLSKILGVT